MSREVLLMGDLGDITSDIWGAFSAIPHAAYSLGQEAGGGGSSSGDDGAWYDSELQASSQAAADLAKRSAEAQQAAIVHGAEQAAAGFRKTAAGIESHAKSSIGKLVILGALGVGGYWVAKHKGWI